MKDKYLKKLVRPQVLESVAWLPPTGRKNFIKLDQNEGYHVLNDAIMAELRNFDPFIIGSYPEYSPLIKAVSEYVGSPENTITLTNGSDHGIQLLLSLFIHEGDKVVVPAPTFFVYFSLLKLLGAKITSPFYKEHTDSYEFPFQETMDALDEHTKALLLCSPNNPLGPLISEPELIVLIEKATELGIPVVIDEAYYEFGGYTAIPLLKTYDNVIVLRTFSKAFGLAGVRLGYTVAAPSVITEINKLKLPWAVNHFSVYAGETVLMHQDYLKKKTEEIKKLKDKLFDVLTSTGLHCYHTDTNFIIAKTDGHKDLIEKLREAGILVNSVSEYPFSNGILKNGIRISTPSKEHLAKLKKELI